MAENIDDTRVLSNKAKMSTEDKSALASRIDDQFASIMGTVDKEDESTGVIEGTPDKPAGKEARHERNEAPPKEDEAPSETKEEPSTEAAADDAPTLPAAYVRSLKAAEWSDDEIKSAFKSQGTGFLTFARKVHETRNAEIAKMAELGWQAKAGKTGPVAQPAAPAAIPQGALAKLDMEELRKKYGDDELLNVLVGPVNGVIDRINAVLPQVTAAQKRTDQAANDTLGKQVEGFFAGVELKPFKEFYGDGPVHKLPEAQIETRRQVLEYADALCAGAAFQGRTLPVEEALTMAHDAISAKFKKSAAREEIRGELQKRNKGLSVKPSGRGANPGGEKPAKNRDELEKNVASRMKRVFTS